MVRKIYIEYLTHILRCAAKSEVPQDLPDGLCEEEFIEFCCFHKTEIIVYKLIGDKLSEKTRTELENRYEAFLRIQAAQQYYLELLESELESAGIDYLVLKGRELAKLYPSEDMRQSADFDIYVGHRNAERVRDIMVKIGFSTLAYDPSNDDHDEYIADNCVVAEVHRVLIQGDSPWRTECNKMTERLRRSGDGHCMEFSPTDFYVYNLAHCAKHIRFSGIGIRAFFDLWLVHNSLADVMDCDELEETLKRCKLDRFNENALTLCEYWFEGKTDLPPIIADMAEFVAESGWVGTAEQARATELAKNAGATGSVAVAKVRKCVSILRTPYEGMVKRYPILLRHRWLMPFCRLHRGVAAVLGKRELIRSVTSELEMGDMADGKRIVKLKRDIGL